MAVPAAGPDPPFVGRARELDALAGACERAACGRGGLVLVTGDAGVGKTALMREAARRAEGAGFAVGWGDCWPDGGSPPLWPWPGLLAAAIGRDAARLLHDDHHDHDDHDDHDGDDMGRDRFARFRAVADAVARRAASTPLLLVIDDVHAAEVGTLLLTRMVAASAVHEPVLILAARRTAARARGPRAGRLLHALERHVDVVHVDPFGPDEIASFLAVHGVRAADEDPVPALARVTGGNPLLLVRAVARGATEGVAAGLDRAVGEVLTELSPAHRDVLAVAAVLGPDGLTADLRDVLGGTVSDALAGLAAGAAAGLVDAGSDRWSFTHDLVRQAALEVLGPDERLETHARAARLRPRDERPGTVVQRARHARAAATRSASDAEFAVGCCRRAATVLAAGFDHEGAAELLAAAVDLAGQLGPATEHVDLLLDWADALQVCGTLGDARAAYERSVEAAAGAGDPVAAARAALGLGGVWLDEHRGETERRRVLGLQQAAAVALPVEATSLRVRLTCRLASEAVYDGADVGPVREALAAARELGDQRALSEALSLAHHALLAPDHLDERLVIADELLAVASASGDALRALFGLMWKTVDQFLGGDRRAGRSLDELRRRADAVGCRSIAFIVAAIDVMGLIREGRLDDAERAAHECFELGVEVGDADSTGYYGAHLLTIRWLQDRDGDLLDLARDIASSHTLVPPEFAFLAGSAAVAARAGQVEEAAAVIRRLTAGGLDSLTRSSTWLTGIVNLVEAACVLGDASLARAAYDLLEPYAGRPVMPSLAVSCFGSVERALGLAALTWHDPGRAVHHLQRAVRANVALGHRPATAVARADLARALLVRDRPADRRRARESLVQAADDADRMGMGRRAREWRQTAAAIELEPDLGRLCRAGEGWTIEIGERSVAVPDLVGLDYLGVLLARPGEEVAAIELCGGVSLENSEDHLIDRPTLDAYRRRVEELDRQLARARAGGPSRHVRRLLDERDALRSELSAVLTHTGRPRRFTGSTERARTSVRKALARALDVIAGVDGELAHELRTTISTGTHCVYRPDPTCPRRWHVDGR
jgi:hypothetical protein